MERGGEGWGGVGRGGEGWGGVGRGGKGWRGVGRDGKGWGGMRGVGRDGKGWGGMRGVGRDGERKGWGRERGEGQEGGRKTERGGGRECLTEQQLPERRDFSSDSPAGWQEPEREKLTAFSSSLLVSFHLPPPHYHSTQLQHL